MLSSLNPTNEAPETRGNGLVVAGLRRKRHVVRRSADRNRQREPLVISQGTLEVDSTPQSVCGEIGSAFRRVRGCSNTP